MSLVVTFDVNETLLDLASLDPLFIDVFGDSDARSEWFSSVIHTATVITATGGYDDFGHIAEKALQALAARRGIDLKPHQIQNILQGMRRLPLHPDVVPALDRLRTTNARLATLTNSRLAIVQEQLASAGIRERFHHILSCETVQQLKPGPKPYHLVSDTFQVPIKEVVLIAAHGWDITGALAAGAQAIFVQRSGQSLLPVGPPPRFVAANLMEAVSHLFG